MLGERLFAAAALVLALAVGPAARPQSTRMEVFPGRASTSRSPNLRYALVNTDSEKAEPPHRLYLLDTQGGKRILLLGYPRWVSTLWSPASNALAVNDHSASNQSDCYVFVLGKQFRRIDILAELRKEFPGNPTLFLNDHVYLEAVKWTSPDRLRIKAYGHGSQNPGGFQVFFEYRIGGRVRELSRGKQR